MDTVIKRIVRRLFPELTSGLHLPRWGKVVALPELPTEEGERGSDAFYPRYAVDVQLLDENGTETKSKPLQAVPLPLPGAGNKAGRLEPPAIGSIVEIGFAYGRPDKPFIRTVLPFGWDLPAIKAGETRNQVRDGVYRHIDDKGNFDNKTDKDDKLECLNQRIKILENKIEEIAGDLTQTIGGTKATTAERITMNGGKAVVTCAHICHFTGAPHGDGSSTVTAGK
ncbi:conserved hypothetical protein [Shewanella halifaxensis HAW-EB4]|uniref:Gp5/Type VI secretion system Vgr protein OB-fold domain-containing protein n=1 Tax=Shewanella halifaxensis (strain HAW-EB4) TaxID=458817 RepID=B0TLF9_SHEHH|nr:hypothetical protein [Shewanella halifaxensis]ABZ75909.1 conserved hypothetical protein [Shewanella halifaxensis HAW-EB4]